VGKFSLTAALAIVLAALCRLPSMHRRPVVIYWLWLLLVVKLVTPPLVAVPLLPALPGNGDVSAVVPVSGQPTWDPQLAFEPHAQAIPAVYVTTSTVVNEGAEGDAAAVTSLE